MNLEKIKKEAHKLKDLLEDVPEDEVSDDLVDSIFSTISDLDDLIEWIDQELEDKEEED